MRKSLSFVTLVFGLLLFLVTTAAFAVVTESTSVLTIQNGLSKREPISTVLGVPNTVKLRSSFGAGAAAGIGVTATEYGDGNLHTTTLTFVATPMNVRDTEQGGGLKVYDFPAGRIAVIGVTGAVNFTTTTALASTLNAGVSSRWGVGTVTQANATLATTEQNLIPVTTFLSSATINVAPTLVPGALAASAQFDGTTTAIDAFLNMSVPLATDIDADASVAANGTITISWINLGDY